METNLALPTFSTFARRSSLELPPNSVYIFSGKWEDRARPLADWRSFNTNQGVTFVEIGEPQRGFLTWSAEGSEPLKVNLRDSTAVDDMLGSFGQELYLDITGVPLNLWAPLVPRLRESGANFRVVYSEPARYTRNPLPSPGRVFDLSKAISGIRPVPSFAKIGHANPADAALVPILGFEGFRLQHVLDESDIDSRNIFPILASPGFRLEYPNFSVLGNADPLVGRGLTEQMTLARANCPFELFCAVQAISERSHRSLLKISPLGTKPHALGAVLYAMASPERSELYYDHAIPHRFGAEGKSRTWTFYVSEFMRSSFFQRAMQ